MARGGTSPQKPRLGEGRGTGLIARAAAVMMAFNAARSQDRYETDTSQEPAPMTAGASSSDSESVSGGKSPIQNEELSYAARQREAGTESERVRQAQMLETGEQFAGAPAIPSAESRAGEEAQQAGEETQARPEAAPEETTEESMQERLAQEAQDYAAESARFSAETKRLAAQNTDIINDQQRRDKKSEQEQNAKIWRGLTMLSGMTSFTGVSYVFYFVASNVRMIYGSLFPDNPYVPKPTLAQIGTATVSDIQCCLCTPAMAFFCCLAAVLGVAAYFTVKLISNLFS